MRIISGIAGGRQIRVPPGKGVRPTTDRVREALFSHLGSTIQDARILDLFAGSGALGLEGLSRGATYAVFVERSRTTARWIEENVRHLGFDGRARIFVRDALTYLQDHDDRNPFHLVFLDPPYDTPLLTSALRLLAERCLLHPEGIVVLEHPNNRSPEIPDQFEVFRNRKYGTTAITTLRWQVWKPETDSENDRTQL